MANLAGEITLRVTRDELELASRTDYTYTAGGQVLTITTVIPAPGIAFELVSIYAAAPGTDTIATHLTQGYERPGVVTSSRYTNIDSELHPVLAPRGCAYHHANRLLDELADLELHVELAELAFAELERVE